MEDDIGKKLKKKVMDWKKNKLVEESADPRGSSSLNFFNELFLSKGSIFQARELDVGCY